MPAAVQTAVFANTPAWHGLGTVLDTEGNLGIDVETAITESGLDWEVEKVKIQSVDGDFIDNRWGVRRMTDKRMLGVVGNTWQPVQNRDGFAIIQDVLEQAGNSDNPVWIEAAGELDDGRVWILAHCAQHLQVAGEDYASYMLFTNGHNGRMSVTCALLDMRVVCANTLEFGLAQEQKGQGRIIRVRHTTKAAERIKAAHHMLGLRNTRLEELARAGEFLVDSKINEGEFNTFLESLMPIKEGAEDTPAGTMISNRRTQVQRVYMEAPNLEPIRGTRWGALQAVIEYSDHHREFQSDQTQVKAQWGITPATIKQQAFDYLYATA